MKVGLYFGTFNPIHIGHLVIANYMATHTDLDEIWLIVSPQNPLKEKSTLLDDHHRLDMAFMAVENNDFVKVSNIEFSLAKPSYTTLTLTYLQEKYPENIFSLIMGEDNIRTFHKWKNYQEIINNHQLYVYPRVEIIEDVNSNIINKSPLTNLTKEEQKKITFCNKAPIMKISASAIRESIKANKSVRYLIPDKLIKYIDDMNFYKKQNNEF